MASRTQIVCLCEGEKGGGSGKHTSIDQVFISRLMKSLQPDWLRPRGGSNVVRLVPCGGRKTLIEKMPGELRTCLNKGADTTLMVWADCDDDCADGDALKDKFWQEAQQAGIGQTDFDRVVFIFAKDRLENWIQFLNTGKTDEAEEGPRLRHSKKAAEAARKLAKLCKAGRSVEDMPPSLRWSCKGWRSLVQRMKKS